MDATILKNKPMSGEYREHFFNSPKGETTTVLFEDNNYEEYCGIFSGGDIQESKVVVNEGIAFVLAKGKGYIFDVNKRAIIYHTEHSYLTDVLSGNTPNVFVASTFTELIVYQNEESWISKRISSDGINLREVANNILYGQVFNFFDWVPFTLNLETYEYDCEWEF
ncbi:hypothetical protein WH96_11295 [Kiloniella spongiae]|uniref:Uncharacterized protein n=1 Tax=Kiloniella spongiae TaxID=1489064 RepID=A0A0H2MFM1_9PROT|nr:hypothetical protein [Kiloniella spongiae]KLN61001.1 hypothetical protein WH96_11295 [Kiloniella spongiae]